MNSSHGDARRWLEHVLGEDGVPDYQITKVSLELLERLRRKCGEAAHMESRLRLLKELDIVELEAETKRVVNIIERSGLEFPDRPISINPLCQILSVLCEISLDLDLEDPRSVQISLLMSELQLKSAKIPMHQLKRNKGEDERRKAKLRSLKDLSRNSRILESTSREVKRGLESATQSTKSVEFLKEKQWEYAKKAERAESGIRSKSGFGKEMSHEKIVALKREIGTTQAEILSPLRLKLESFRDLPPDVGLARLKVAEAERELAALTNVLSQQINMMHV